MQITLHIVARPAECLVMSVVSRNAVAWMLHASSCHPAEGQLQIAASQLLQPKAILLNFLVPQEACEFF